MEDAPALQSRADEALERSRPLEVRFRDRGARPDLDAHELSVAALQQGDPRVNLQPGSGGKAKLYQIRQVLQAIDRLLQERKP